MASLVTGPAPASMARARTVRRHGIVVVHGQGLDRVAGGFLAEMANSVADVLEAQGGAVQRSFDRRTDPSTARIVATPPHRPGATEAPVREYRFTEAFWDDAFPPPRPRVVLLWVIADGWRQVGRMMRGWLTDPTNARRGQDALDPDERPIPLPFWVGAFYRLELVVLRLLLAVAYLLWVPAMAVVYALNVLATTPVVSALGVWRFLAEAALAIDPFMSKVMGDSQRYVEDGMWAASARGALERAVVAQLEDTSLESVTIVAHSAGGGVAYDALLEGSAIGEAIAALPPRGREPGVPLPSRLMLVTLGSAVNRYYWLSEHGKTAFARRYRQRRLDPRVVGAADAMDGDAEDARERFAWIDMYARLDPVAAGPLRGEVLDAAGIDPRQVSHRQVIAGDNPFSDHGAYFSNRAFVMPRLIRAISGGEDPWPVAGEEDGRSWVEDGARRHLARLARLQAFRFALLALGLVYAAGAAVSHGWRHAPAEAVMWLLRWVERVPGVDLAGSPFFEYLASSNVAEALGTAAAILALYALLLAVERAVARTFFADVA